MELPKNITQIGEVNPNCKVYVEDYVISFAKQMNRAAENKSSAVALYGKKTEENGITYIFFYGACKLETLQREVRHLSQAQIQETEKFKKKYFPRYQFLGYRILTGEMIEGFHVYEQGICRYIEGYACFYEKNDGMLAYMLDTRQEMVKPEEVDQEKYEEVKQRQEERRAQHLEAASKSSKKSIKKPTENTVAPVRTIRIMRTAVVGVFVLLCVIGVTTLNGTDKLKELQTAASHMFDELTEQKIPDAGEAVEVMNPTGAIDTLVAEDKLTEAIQKENENYQPTLETDEVVESEQVINDEPEQSDEPEPSVEPEASNEPEVLPSQEASAPISYTIQKGDTLIGISMLIYGTEDRVEEICALNNITDPDNIQFGQKILLP